ncbi:MAG: energy transducer TonB [Bacteroidota bacterium]
MEKEVFKLLNQKKKLNLLKKIKKDTLSINLTILVNANGKIIKESSYFRINAKKLNEKSKSSLNGVIRALPIFKILNRKTAPVISKHFLNFQYAILRAHDEIKLEPIKTQKKYTGGTIEETPIFPGCENLSDTEATACFHKKMKNHIKYHFKYPSQAVSQGISGKVYTIFSISQTGKVENIRVRGPHLLLEREALRILKFLPDMIPGKRNGDPVKVPYSIPITFTLNKKTP